MALSVAPEKRYSAVTERFRSRYREMSVNTRTPLQRQQLLMCIIVRKILYIDGAASQRARDNLHENTCIPFYYCIMLRVNFR